jgi:hypothetical protein
VGYVRVLQIQPYSVYLVFFIKRYVDFSCKIILVLCVTTMTKLMYTFPYPLWVSPCIKSLLDGMKPVADESSRRGVEGRHCRIAT